MVGRLRITNPILAITCVNGYHEAITLPTGAVVETDGKAFNGDRFVEVRMNGVLVMVFTDDLRANSMEA